MLAARQDQRSIRAAADFSSIKFNQRYVAPNQTPRLMRNARAANGGDISQLGISRLVADPRSHLYEYEQYRAYFQPHQFDFGETNVIAARVTVTLPHSTGWDTDKVARVQQALTPKADLTDEEVERIVQGAMTDAMPFMAAAAHQIVAFINTAAKDNSNVADVLRKAADNNLDADMHTVAVGARGEQVAALSAKDVMGLDIEDLTKLTEACKDATNLKHLAMFMGAKMYEIKPILAAAYEPYATAVEKARVSKMNTISQEVVDEVISEHSRLRFGENAAMIKQNIVVEVVTKGTVAYHRAPEFTNVVITEEETDAMAIRRDQAVTAAVRERIVNSEVALDADWIAIINGGNDDEFDNENDHYEDIGDWVAFEVEETEYLIALGRFAIGAVGAKMFITEDLTPSALAEFSVARANIVEHSLCGESTEVHRVAGMEWVALSVNKSLPMFDRATENIAGYVVLATSHISYMKSGHHVSANNIGTTYLRIHTALQNGDAIDVTEVPEALALGVYYGSHPADVRAVAVFLRNMSSKGQLSYAIGRRITPHGPGTVSMFLLNLVMRQLDHIKFFSYLNREEEYNNFKSLYAAYAATSYLETPYAAYMYGLSKSESVILKQQVNPMYAYAAAISIAMPNSTIGDSVALSRDAMASANNAIVARLEVESFVRSYKTYLRSIVRKRLDDGAKVEGGVQLLEDG